MGWYAVLMICTFEMGCRTVTRPPAPQPVCERTVAEEVVPIAKDEDLNEFVEVYAACIPAHAGPPAPGFIFTYFKGHKIGLNA